MNKTIRLRQCIKERGGFGATPYTIVTVSAYE